ncbi:hypothetical protein OHB12_35000 [Nocardia sp. NBC_01730]|uniref:hypothetical protein n=1 Tax=Nocardia sp. NBC_01730 TaxID=2975998 RepID=UPI002E0D95DC|nr:hypothetical protein OHB12_35000 [Nocardia sp. NBC_01730]
MHYVLGLSIFAQGTSELMLAGLLTEMAGDLGVSVPQAGLLISGFALGMLVGAPVLAVATLRWSVALLSAAAMLGILLKIPGGRPAADSQIRKELRTMVRPQLWLSYGTTALAIGALLVSFAYLGALLSDTTRLADDWIPVVLAIYGLGGFVGIVAGGRTADAHPLTSLYVGMTGVVVTSALLAMTAEYAVPSCCCHSCWALSVSASTRP